MQQQISPAVAIVILVIVLILLAAIWFMTYGKPKADQEQPPSPDAAATLPEAPPSDAITEPESARADE